MRGAIFNFSARRPHSTTLGLAVRRIVLHWVMIAVTFIVTAAIVLLPVLFLLALTPLHDGSDSPGPVLLYSTLFLAALIAAAAAWLVRWRLRQLATTDG